MCRLEVAVVDVLLTSLLPEEEYFLAWRMRFSRHPVDRGERKTVENA